MQKQIKFISDHFILYFANIWFFYFFLQIYENSSSFLHILIL